MHIQYTQVYDVKKEAAHRLIQNHWNTMKGTTFSVLMNIFWRTFEWSTVSSLVSRHQIKEDMFISKKALNLALITLEKKGFIMKHQKGLSFTYSVTEYVKNI